jgi:hypothetical protein
MAPPDANYLEQALAARITGLGPGTVKVTPTDAGGFIIVAAFNVINNVEHHSNVANKVLSQVNQLGLYAVRLIATRTATRAAEGLITGLVTGLGTSATQKSELAPWITLISGFAGGVIGNFIEHEIEVFEWRRDGAGRWYDTQLAPPPPLDWGWQALPDQPPLTAQPPGAL